MDLSGNHIKWIRMHHDGEIHPSKKFANERVFMGNKRMRGLPKGWTRWREAGFSVENGIRKAAP